MVIKLVEDRLKWLIEKEEETQGTYAVDLLRKLIKLNRNILKEIGG